MVKIFLLTPLLFLGLSLPLVSQVVHIPDFNFKNALLNNLSINTNNDAEIQLSEAQAYNGTIGVYNKEIYDLRGIEAFTALTGLNCQRNELVSIDLSKNTALTTLDCSFNQLTALDLSKNNALINVNCSSNHLSVLDLNNISGLTALSCFFNQLTTLDLRTNPLLQTVSCNANQLNYLNINGLTELYFLNCQSNQLPFLNLSSNTKLGQLRCAVNKLFALDVSNNPDLVDLDCSQNLLTDIIFDNLMLERLWCYSNQLSYLDLSILTALSNVWCSSNELTTLIVQNGINHNFSLFSCENNPLLKCIEVDDSIYSSTHWYYIDSTASFSTNCPETLVSEASFYQLKPYPNPSMQRVRIITKGWKNLSIRLYSINGQLIHAQNELNCPAIEIDISDYNSGVYILRIIANKLEKCTKLIKH